MLKIFKKKRLPVEKKKTVLQAKSKLSTSTGDTSKRRVTQVAYRKMTAASVGKVTPLGVLFIPLPPDHR